MIACCVTAVAQMPRRISFQGIFTRSDGKPLDDGPHNVEVELWNDQTAGSKVWSEKKSVVTLNGSFELLLGDSDSLLGALDFDHPYYLTIIADGAELSPRIPLTSVPYALRSLTANQALTVAPNAPDVVTRVNGQDGELTLRGSGTIAVNRIGSEITISAGSGTPGTLTGLQSTSGVVGIADGTGPIADLTINPGAIDNTMLSDGAVTAQKINDGTITATKMSIDGAATGQVLTFNGASVVWSDPRSGPLLLPQRLTASDNDVLLGLANSGTGSAARFLNTNRLNASPALTVSTSGVGPALLLSNDGGGTSVALSAASGGLLFSGTTGGTPATGAGTRMMWVPSKAAFRAGTVNNVQWDGANIGSGSVAMGTSTFASGVNSVAMGDGSVASKNGSVAIGSNVTANGTNAVALGDGTLATGTTALASGNRSYALGDYSMAMGNSNLASGAHSVVIGDSSNATGRNAIAMGLRDSALGESSVALGSSSMASGRLATAIGYRSMGKGGYSTAIHGGVAIGDYSVAMGDGDSAIGEGSVAIGAGCMAKGAYSLAMGTGCRADAPYSIALGYKAFLDNTATRSFLFVADSTGVWVQGQSPNTFYVSAPGGVAFYSGWYQGVFLSPGGGSWQSISDRRRKENFRTEDGELALSRIAAMPIQSWNYISQPDSIRHLGPTAQDFRAAFGLGESDTTITTVDIDGVNMLAVQALERRTAQLREAQEELRRSQQELRRKGEELDMLKRQLQEFDERLRALESGGKLTLHTDRSGE
jgi:hypothetical protein